MLAPRKPTLCWSICFSDTARGKSEWRSGSPSREPEGTSSPPAPGRRGAGAGGPPRPHVTSAGRRRGRGCWGLRRPPPPLPPAARLRGWGPGSAGAGQLRSPRIGHLPCQSFRVASPAGRDWRGARTAGGSGAGNEARGGGAGGGTGGHPGEGAAAAAPAGNSTGQLQWCSRSASCVLPCT